jgi:hypothetical protein
LTASVAAGCLLWAQVCPAGAQARALFETVAENQLAGASPASSSLLSQIRQRPTTASVELVRINHEALRGSAANLALPIEGTVAATSRQTILRGEGDYTWIGEIPGRGQAIFVVRNGDVTGHVQSGGNVYSVTPLGGGIHALVKIDQSKFPPDHPSSPRR